MRGGQSATDRTELGIEGLHLGVKADVRSSRPIARTSLLYYRYQGEQDHLG